MKQACRALRLRWRIALGILVVGILVTYTQRDSLLSAAGRWLNVSSALIEPVDDVLVLGGDASTRPFVASGILRAGLARRILIPQVAGSLEVRDGVMPPHHEIVREVLLQSGVRAEAIAFLPAVVDSTDREAQSLADFLELHPDRRVAVVTSDFHTRRTRVLFSRVCRAHAARLRFIGAPTDGFNASNWWRFEMGFILYINEYVKLIKAYVS